MSWDGRTLDAATECQNSRTRIGCSFVEGGIVRLGATGRGGASSGRPDATALGDGARVGACGMVHTGATARFAGMHGRYDTAQSAGRLRVGRTQQGRARPRARAVITCIYNMNSYVN